MPKLAIYWIRRDFRLVDNLALFKAVQFSEENKIDFLPVFIIDPQILSKEANVGLPRRELLNRILINFSRNFERFVVACGKPVDIFSHIASKNDIYLFYNDDIEPYALQRDGEIRDLFNDQSRVNIYQDQVSVDLNKRAGSGNIYTVYSPFRNAVWDEFVNSKVVKKPDLAKLQYFHGDLPGLDYIDVSNKESIDEAQSYVKSKLQAPWSLCISDRYGQTFEYDLSEFAQSPDTSYWYADESEALKQFESFNKHVLLGYKHNRDDLALDTIDKGQTSKLSLALKWGLISPRYIVQEIKKTHGEDLKSNENTFQYVSELVWREFYKYILFHHPYVLNLEFQEKFRNKINWVDTRMAKSRFEAWMKAKTGYKLVDAAMSQMLSLGWMHNRSRMLVASILSKNLGVDWRWGQDFFRAVLVDLDESSNNGGWQWAASTGSDPKPIRIFNPYLQAEKYDKDNKYQLKWLPSDYNISSPIIEHATARQEALQRYGLNKDKTPYRDY